MYNSGTPASSYTGTTTIYAGSVPRTLTWKLHYFKGNLAGSLSGSKLPLVVGLHHWSDGTTVPNLLNLESTLMAYEGSWEDVLFLTVALENGNNLNTWWDGSKVNGVPTTWAMDGIVSVIKSRILDGAGLLGLSAKAVDTNRVYLVGTSMGGSGTYHIGIRHPELFAAIHANAGFADYEGGPCGIEAFCTSFTNDFLGTAAENLQMKGLDGQNYPARNYSNMSWFVGAHNGASWTASLGKGKPYEPPYISMTHGKADDAVNISSANRLAAVLKAKNYGYSFSRHSGGHSGENFLHLEWLLGFRKDQSYLALANNSTDVTSGGESYNFLNRIGWQPGTVQDSAGKYQVTLSGTGTTDITPRRLQAFKTPAGTAFRYWINGLPSGGLAVTVPTSGVLTLKAIAVAGSTTLTIRRDGSVPPVIDTTPVPPVVPPIVPPVVTPPIAGAVGPVPVLAVPYARTITVNSVATLVSAIASAPKKTTILLADGTYSLGSVWPLRLRTDSIALYGASRDPSKVILRGQGFGTANTDEELIKIEAKAITLAYFTLRDGRANGLKIQTGGNDNLLVHNVYFVDICERSIKAPEVPVSRFGEIRYCLFEQVTPITSSIPNLYDGGNYIAGMDLMRVEGWYIHDNTFRNIRGMTGGARAAVFAWNQCKGLRIERNTIQGCDRGIALGNPGTTVMGADSSIVRDNVIFAGEGISLEICNTSGTRFTGNTIFDSPSYFRTLQLINNGGNVFRGNIIQGKINLISGATPNWTGNVMVTDFGLNGQIQPWADTVRTAQ